MTMMTVKMHVGGNPNALALLHRVVRRTQGIPPISAVSEEMASSRRVRAQNYDFYGPRRELSIRATLIKNEATSYDFEGFY